MTTTEQQNNKRIAKNTLLLYFRMFFTMAVGLYTSRVILKNLGVEDFGIYNVVGGVVTMFTIISFAMSCATGRFITFSLGEGNSDKLNRVFSTSVLIHIIVAVIIIALAETIGLWFFNNKLVIPSERLIAAKWVYHFSVFSCVVMILSVPYNALITSHEKMGAFAYISVLEVVLKLAIAMGIVYGGIDRLILYGMLMLAVQILIRVIYQLYCHRTFKSVKFSFCWDRQISKDMLGYATWSLVGSASNLLAIHGQNILLNTFFGPVVNAARGIAVQVQNAIQQFSSSFQTAMFPQINKSFARGDLQYMHSLIIACSKYSFYLLLFISLPIFIEIKQILNLWLVEPPEHSASFIRLMIVICVLNALGTPISTAAGAHGKIRNFQLVVGGIMLLVVPVSYITLKLNSIPEYIFIAQIFISSVAQVARLLIVKKLIGLPLRKYFAEVFVKGCTVALIASVIPFAVYRILQEGLVSFVLIVTLSCVCTLCAVYVVGLNNAERNIAISQIRQIFQKLKKA